MLIEKVKKFITNNQLIEPGELVLLAFSGGVDSTALLHILLSFKEEINFKLALAHFNHMIRGEEADKDENFVRDVAEKEGLKLEIGRYDVPMLAKKQSLSLEDAARKARYEFLFRTAQKLNAQKIAIAHNRGDKAETFLINLLRGSGAKGLSGMKPVQHKIIRPLLECQRGEIEQFLKKRHIQYRIDSTNIDTKYIRNRIRHNLIPYLEKQFNQNIESILVHEADIIAEEDNYLQAEARKIFDKISEIDEKESHFKINSLIELHKALQRRILRLAIQHIKVDLKRITWSHINDIIQIFIAPSNEAKITLPQGIIHKKCNKEIIIGTNLIKTKVEFSKNVTIPGSVNIKEIDESYIIKLEQIKAEKKLYIQKNNKKAFLDAEKIEKQLLVRNRREGDIFFPLGSKGKKKLKAFFIDKKIPRQKRDMIPLFISRGEIAWVAGLAIGEHFKLSSSTRKVVIIERG
jgi:tRNA(Ile)-lysidine synthase